uniref:C-type lectin domain-containing protein n=1 Tax=Astatotilapia calliptera TaxID=8154 RepID=A0AAX7SW35_ASTCA
MSGTDVYKNSEAEFRNWAPGDPNNQNGNEECGQMIGTGEWNDVPCYLNVMAVCSSVRGANVTFILINNPMTWTEARSFCRAHYTDLASVRNMSENQKIKELIPAGQKVWIGLFRGWMWTDGSKTSFTYWNVNQPSSVVSYNCAALYFGAAGKWESYTCDFQRGFVCYNGSEEKQKEVVPLVSKHVVKVRLEKSPSLGLKDSAVQDEMLQQGQCRANRLCLPVGYNVAAAAAAAAADRAGGQDCADLRLQT